MAGFLSPPRIDSLISSADVLRTKKPGSYLNGSISSYTPSVSEGAEQKITGLLSYVMPRREAAKLAHKVASFADFTPVGDAVTAAQAGQDFRQGNILSGLGNTAIAAIGVVPGVGDVAAKGIKKGIRAFHGSPHDFDKFSLSKIGTGEGAQAYGHGLYFAENKAVADNYRHTLGAAYVSPKVAEFANYAYQKAVAEGLDGPDAIRRGQSLLSDIAKAETNPYQRQSIYDAVNNLDGLINRPPGRLYEVNINADPDSLLDWDKPLGEQPETVLRRLPPNSQMNAADVARPYDLLNELTRGKFNNPGNAMRSAAASERLRAAGIPGIKYLDQGSRTAGDGSRNFVIFDDSIIDILNKY